MTTVAIYNPSANDLLLQAEAFGLSVHSGDQRIIAAGSGKPLGELPPQVLLAEVKAIVQGACRDLGINKGADEYDATRFFDMLRQHFATMTVADVKQAFELYVLGELDKYLPHDGKGKPIAHYQQFSATFYVAVLRAYRAKQFDTRRHIAGKVQVLLLEQEASQRDPYEVRCEMLEVLRDLSVAVARKENPLMTLVASSEWCLQKVKLLPPEILPTDDDMSRARVQLSHNRDSAVNSGIGASLRNGIIPDDLAARARFIAMRRMMREEAERLGPEQVAARFNWLIDFYRKKQRA